MTLRPTTSVQKDAATAFLELATSGRAREAFRTYAGPRFRHHNPFFADDAESLMIAMDENAAKFPNKRLEVKRVIEEGDLVVVHSRVRHTADEQGFALTHIFRFEGDRIVELWDLAQEIPRESPNSSGMF